VLAAVGVGADEERLYEILLSRPGATAPELTSRAAASRSTVQALLDGLELKGLVTHSPSRTRRYFPAPPDVAVEALILKQQEALQRVRVAAARLQDARAGRAATARRTSG